MYVKKTNRVTRKRKPAGEVYLELVKKRKAIQGHRKMMLGDSPNDPRIDY